MQTTPQDKKAFVAKAKRLDLPRWKHGPRNGWRQRRRDGVTGKVWGALTSMIRLEDKVNGQVEAMKIQHLKIEDLTGRVIRLEAQQELLTGATMVRKRKRATE